MSSEEVYFHVSVIVPAHDDAGMLSYTLKSLVRQSDVQVVVVDSGSIDDTVSRAQKYGVKVVASAETRGRQMRAGVDASHGDVLVFCPPGNILSEETIRKMLWALSNPNVVGGEFDFAFAGRQSTSMLLDFVYRALRALGLRPHDLAWFAWRTACEGENEFRRMRVFEDVEMLRRLRREGRVIRLSTRSRLVPANEPHRLIWTLLQLPYQMGLFRKAMDRLYKKPPCSRRPLVNEAITGISANAAVAD